MSERRDESKLPKWARRRLAELREAATAAEADAARTRAAHAVLMEREWFTLPAPSDVQEWPDGKACLFFLCRNEAVRLCSLGEGDVLVIGRKKPGTYTLAA